MLCPFQAPWWQGRPGCVMMTAIARTPSLLEMTKSVRRSPQALASYVVVRTIGRDWLGGPQGPPVCLSTLRRILASIHIPPRAPHPKPTPVVDSAPRTPPPSALGVPHGSEPLLTLVSSRYMKHKKEWSTPQTPTVRRRTEGADKILAGIYDQQWSVKLKK